MRTGDRVIVDNYVEVTPESVGYFDFTGYTGFVVADDCGYIEVQMDDEDTWGYCAHPLIGVALFQDNELKLL